MCRRRTAAALAVAALLVSVVAPSLPAGAAGVRPDFQIPFPCGEVWKATTYSGHRGIDWNWGVGSDDLGKPVAAAAAGVATTKWNSGYGYYVDVDHGGGWVTRYAHLLSHDRVSGYVAQGQPIGRVGSTGRSTGPHLHWEQIADGQPVSTYYADDQALRPDGRTYASRNCRRARPFASRDAHGDGVEDMVARFTRSSGASTMRLLRGAPRRQLRASRALDTDARQLPAGSMLTLGDTNGKGAADLNAAFAADGGVRFVTFPATAEGVFGDRRSRHLASRWRFDRLRSLHAGDVDGDGIADMIAPFLRGGGGTVVRVLKGRSARALSARAALRVDAADIPPAALLAVGDTDGDGRADLNAVVPTATGVRFVSFRGRADGTFGRPRIRYATDAWDPRQLRELHAGDVNGDGFDDLVVRLVEPSGRSGIWTVRGGATRSLRAVSARRPPLSALPARARIAVGDTDADGRADLNATFSADGGSRFVTFPGLVTAAFGRVKVRHESSWSYARLQ